nr:sugar transferase [Bacteroidota bacterium]
MKRFFDVFFSAAGLALFSPVFLLLSFWITTGSKGGVFYRQKRVGK